MSNPHDPPVTPPAGMTGRPGPYPDEVGQLGPLMRIVKNQGLAFLLVGGFNTALGTLWFIAWQLALGDQLGYHFAIVAGYVCNVACAFAMYRYLVFEVRGHLLRDLWRFVVVNFGAFALNLALMTVAVSVLAFPPIPSQLVITAATATASFFGYRDFSFRRKAVSPQKWTGTP